MLHPCRNPSTDMHCKSIDWFCINLTLACYGLRVWGRMRLLIAEADLVSCQTSAVETFKKIVHGCSRQLFHKIFLHRCEILSTS